MKALNPDKKLYIDLALMSSFKRRDAINEFLRDYSRMPKVIVFDRRRVRWLMGPGKVE